MGLGESDAFVDVDVEVVGSGDGVDESASTSP
jgi:hypothetical protein